MENENYVVQVTPNRKGRDKNLTIYKSQFTVRFPSNPYR